RRFEVVLRAGCVNEAGGLEAVFLEEDQADAPAVLRDVLLAVAAAGATGGGAVNLVEAGHAAMLDAEFSHLPERVGCRHFVCGDVLRLDAAEHLEEWFGPLVRRAGDVEPQRHFTVTEGVGFLLTKAKLVLVDLFAAAAALRAAGCSVFNHVTHCITSDRSP